jgi:6-phosphofructokinase 1
MAGTKIGIITGGGDAPGLNATIQAVVVGAKERGWQTIGFKAGWAGPIKNDWEEVTIGRIKDIQRAGGTILGTSRTNPAKVPKGYETIIKNCKKLGLSALVAIGGEDTLGVAQKLYQKGIKIVGIPKTIDNDVGETDYTFGFDTAVTRVSEALDRLVTTTQAHHRTVVVEIMGRHAGWITLSGGITGGAHVILIPEVPFKTEEVCQVILDRYKQGLTFALVACAEGAQDPELAKKVNQERKIVRRICKKQKLSKEMIDRVVGKIEYDAFGHPHLGGIGDMLAKEINRTLASSISAYMPAGIKFEARMVRLGHLQRGGSPTPFDRMLGIRFGLEAVDLISKKKFGQMTALRGEKVIGVSLKKALAKIKTVPPFLYKRMNFFWEKS